MSKLSIGLLQTSLVWQSPSVNRAHFESIIDKVGVVDVLVLPEMFTTGFSATDTAGAEPPGGSTEQWLIAQARRVDAAIYGSIKVEEGGRFYNRGLFVAPDGQVQTYDKRHLFRMADEHHCFSPGSHRVVVSYRGFRILLQICYDLRFPVWMRNRNDYDAIIVVANWPRARTQAWRSLLIARAIENAAYCIGVNRIGSDNNGVTYSGDSLGVDFKGNVLLDLRDHDDHAVARLDLAELVAFREKFPVHADADAFQITDS